MVATVEEAIGPIDLLVSNAGQIRPGWPARGYRSRRRVAGAGGQSAR
jgi:NADP-dependent 3-hydroxy acid dehydrogenase YdfG